MSSRSRYRRRWFGVLLAIVLGWSSGHVRASLNRKIVYSTASGGWNDMFVMDVPGGTVTPVPLPTSNLGFAAEWSRDGQWLTFAAGWTGAGELYVAHPDGTGLLQLTNISTNGGDPTFSPDASQIAFHHDSSGWQLYTVNTNGTGLTNLGVAGTSPRWSPDGQKLAYTSWGNTYESDIYVYDLVTQTSTQITSHAPAHGFIRTTWSPDGSMLAVSEKDNTTGFEDLWVMNADGSGAVDVTSDWPLANETWPSWSPDGQFIIFNSDHDGSLDIWAMRPDGSDRMNLTNTPGINEANPWIVPEPATTAMTVLCGLLMLNRRRPA